MLLWIFRIVVTLIGIVSLGYLRRVFISGRALQYRGREYGFRLSNHLDATKRVWQLTLITIAVIELFALGLPQIHEHVWIFWIHLCFFAGPFLVLFLVLRHWLTGRRYPVWHFRFVYPCLFLGAVADILGVYMAFLVPAH